MQGRANGMRYLRWGGDGKAVQPESCLGYAHAYGKPPASGKYFIRRFLFFRLISF